MVVDVLWFFGFFGFLRIVFGFLRIVFDFLFGSGVL